MVSPCFYHTQKWWLIFVIVLESDDLFSHRHHSPLLPAIGVDLAGILRGTHGERRRWVSAKWCGVWWGPEGCPLSSRLGGLGSIVCSPVGFGAKPQPKKRFWRILKTTERSFCTYVTKIWGGQFALASPTPNSGGTCPPRPPVIYAHASELFFRAMYL